MKKKNKPMKNVVRKFMKVNNNTVTAVSVGLGAVTIGTGFALGVNKICKEITKCKSDVNAGSQDTLESIKDLHDIQVGQFNHTNASIHEAKNEIIDSVADVGASIERSKEVVEEAV